MTITSTAGSKDHCDEQNQELPLIRYAIVGASTGAVLTITLQTIVYFYRGGEDIISFLLSIAWLSMVVPALMLSRFFNWDWNFTSADVITLPMFAMMFIVNILLWGLLGLLVGWAVYFVKFFIKK